MAKGGQANSSWQLSRRLVPSATCCGSFCKRRARPERSLNVYHNFLELSQWRRNIRSQRLAFDETSYDLATDRAMV
jgi:hypothetical protein